MKNQPYRIYLQVGDECPPDTNFDELADVTWCADRVNDNDLCYVRAGKRAEPTPASTNIASAPCEACDGEYAGYDGKAWHDYCYACGRRLPQRT